MGAPCVNLESGEATLDRPLSFGRYRLEPRGGLMSGAREIRLTPKALRCCLSLLGAPVKSLPKKNCSARCGPIPT